MQVLRWRDCGGCRHEAGRLGPLAEPLEQDIAPQRDARYPERAVVSGVRAMMCQTPQHPVGFVGIPRVIGPRLQIELAAATAKVDHHAITVPVMGLRHQGA